MDSQKHIGHNLILLHSFFFLSGLTCSASQWLLMGIHGEGSFELFSKIKHVNMTEYLCSTTIWFTKGSFLLFQVTIEKQSKDILLVQGRVIPQSKRQPLTVLGQLDH